MDDEEPFCQPDCSPCPGWLHLLLAFAFLFCDKRTKAPTEELPARSESKVLLKEFDSDQGLRSSLSQLQATLNQRENYTIAGEFEALSDFVACLCHFLGILLLCARHSSRQQRCIGEQNPCPNGAYVLSVTANIYVVPTMCLALF